MSKGYTQFYTALLFIIHIFQCFSSLGVYGQICGLWRWRIQSLGMFRGLSFTGEIHVVSDPLMRVLQDDLWRLR